MVILLIMQMIEQVIDRSKDFRIMQSIILITQVSLLENVIVVIALLVNVDYGSFKLVKVRNEYLFHKVF